jgi:hypothetical protein
VRRTRELEHLAKPPGRAICRIVWGFSSLTKPPSPLGDGEVWVSCPEPRNPHIHEGFTPQFGWRGDPGCNPLLHSSSSTLRDVWLPSWFAFSPRTTLRIAPQLFPLLLRSFSGLYPPGIRFPVFTSPPVALSIHFPTFPKSCSEGLTRC